MERDLTTAASDQLDRLLMQLVEDELSDSEAGELRSLLKDCPAAQDRFTSYMALHAWLDWDRGATHERAQSVEVRRFPWRAVSLVKRAARRTVDVFRRPMPLSLLIALFATPILAVAVLAIIVPQWFPQPHLQVENPAPAEFIARLHHLHNVVWTDATAEIQQGKNLVAGDVLRIREGLAEVVFRKGAKIIVKGPAEVRFTSNNGAHLENGSITSRVPISAIGFRIDTHDAEVTDLGTEFAVETNRESPTYVAVFDGLVEMAAKPAKGDAAPVKKKQLVAGEAAQLSPSGIVESAAPPAERFVRQMPPRKSNVEMRTLAQFRLGDDDRAAKAGYSGLTTLDLSSNYTLTRFGEPAFISQTPTPASKFAVAMQKPGDGYVGERVLTSRQDNFLLEVWAKAETTEGTGVVVYNGDGAYNGFGILREGAQWSGIFGGLTVFPMNAEVEVGKWTHLILVRCDGITRVAVDGVIQSPELRDTPRPANQPLSVGGFKGRPEQTFVGQIDDIRLSVISPSFELEAYVRGKQKE